MLPLCNSLLLLFGGFFGVCFEYVLSIAYAESRKKKKNPSAARLEKYHQSFSTVVLLVFVIKNDNNEGD